MTTKEVTFTEARKEFRALLNEVKRSGRPVTITKRGQPQAVLMSCEQFSGKFAKATNGEKPWRLAGSLGPIDPDFDIDKAIAENRRKFRDAFEKRQRELLRELRR